MADPITLASILGATLPKLAGGIGQGLAGGRSKTTQSVSVSQSQGSSVNASVSPVILLNIGGGTVDRPVAGGEIRAGSTSAYSSSVPTLNEQGEPYGLSNYLSLPASARGRASLDVPFPLSTYAAGAGGSGAVLSGGLAGLGINPLFLLAGAGVLLFLVLRKGKR